MTSVKTRLPSRKVLPYSDQLIYEANVVNCNCFYSSIKPTQIDNIWYAHFWTTPHRAKNKRFLTLRCTKTGSTQPKLSAACFVVQSCLADADFVVFSNYCLIGTRHMFVRFLWMLQTVKYPQRSKLPTFHTLSKVLKLHMSFNTVPILWLEGRAGMVRASWYKDDGEYLRTFGYQKKARHCSKYAAAFACWIKSVRTGPIFTAKKQKNKTAKFFQT